MAIKSQKFLPSAELRASKKTISTSLLRDLKSEKPIEMGKVSKEASLGEKFGVIFQFLKKKRITLSLMILMMEDIEIV